MKAGIRRRYRALFALFLAVIAAAESAAGSPYLENVEPLLLERRYSEARLRFIRDNKPPPAGQGQSKAYVQLGETIKFLEALDRDHAMLHAFDMSRIDQMRGAAGGALQLNHRRVDVSHASTLPCHCAA